jgi:hypothetical protein
MASNVDLFTTTCLDTATFSNQHFVQDAIVATFHDSGSNAALYAYYQNSFRLMPISVSTDSLLKL